MIKNVRDLLPGDLAVPRGQSPQAHNSDTDPREINSVSIYSEGVTVSYVDGIPPMSDSYTYDDEVEVATPLPTEPLRLRWRAKDQKWVLNLVSTSVALPAVVVEVNGQTAFDGTPKPLPVEVAEP